MEEESEEKIRKLEEKKEVLNEKIKELIDETKIISDQLKNLNEEMIADRERESQRIFYNILNRFLWTEIKRLREEVKENLENKRVEKNNQLNDLKKDIKVIEVELKQISESQRLNKSKAKKENELVNLEGDKRNKEALKSN